MRQVRSGVRMARSEADVVMVWEEVWRVLKEQLRPRREGEVVISGEITKVFSLNVDRTPPRHQLFLMRIDEIPESLGDVAIAREPDLLVAMQWGQDESQARPIPGLKVGEPVRVRGIYVPPDEAFPAPNGLRHPVVHWTHWPIGWVDYGGKRHGRGEILAPPRPIGH